MKKDDEMIEISKGTKIQLLLPRKPQNALMYKGENMCKVSFPCLCTYENCGRKKGIINWDYIGNENTFVLSEVSVDNFDVNVVSSDADLIALLEKWDVELREGEIVYYDNN